MLDDAGEIFQQGGEWQVIRYAKQCDAENKKARVSLSTQIWNEGKTSFTFEMKNPGSLIVGENRKLTVFLDGTEVFSGAFSVWDDFMPEGWLGLSYYVDGSILDRLVNSKTIRITYKGREVKFADLSGISTAAGGLKMCIEAIYRDDPFVD